MLGAELWGLEMSPQDSCCLPNLVSTRETEKRADNGTFARVLQLACHGYQSRLSDNGFELLLVQVRYVFFIETF